MRISIEREFSLDFYEIKDLLLEKLRDEKDDELRLKILGELLDQINSPESVVQIFEENLGLTASNKFIIDMYEEYKEMNGID